MNIPAEALQHTLTLSDVLPVPPTPGPNSVSGKHGRSPNHRTPNDRSTKVTNTQNTPSSQKERLSVSANTLTVNISSIDELNDGEFIRVRVCKKTQWLRGEVVDILTPYEERCVRFGDDGTGYVTMKLNSYPINDIVRMKPVAAFTPQQVTECVVHEDAEEDQDTAEGVKSEEGSEESLDTIRQTITATIVKYLQSSMVDYDENEIIQLAIFIEHYLLDKAPTLAKYRDESTLNERRRAVMELIRHECDGLNDLKSSVQSIGEFLMVARSQIIWFVISNLIEDDVKGFTFMEEFNVNDKRSALKLFAQAKVDMKNKLDDKQKAITIAAEARFSSGRAIVSQEVPKPLDAQAFTPQHLSSTYSSYQPDQSPGTSPNKVAMQTETSPLKPEQLLEEEDTADDEESLDEIRETTRGLIFSCIPSENLTEDRETLYAAFIEHYLLKEAQTLAEYRDESTLNDRVSAVLQRIRELHKKICNLRSSSEKLEKLLKIKSQVLWFVITILSDNEIKKSKFLKGFTLRYQPKIVEILANAKVEKKSLLEAEQKAAVISAEARFAGRKAIVSQEVPTPPVSQPLAGKSVYVTGEWRAAGLKDQANVKRLARELGGTVLSRGVRNTDAHLLRGSGTVNLHDIPEERQHSPDWLKNQCDLAGVDITLPAASSQSATVTIQEATDTQPAHPQIFQGMTFVFCGALVQVTPDMITSRGGVILTKNQVARDTTVVVRLFGAKLTSRVLHITDEKIYDEEDILKMCGCEVGNAWTRSPILTLVQLCNDYPAGPTTGANPARWTPIRAELYGKYPNLPKESNNSLNNRVASYEKKHGKIPGGMWQPMKWEERIEEAEAAYAKHGYLHSKSGTPLSTFKNLVITAAMQGRLQSKHRIILEPLHFACMRNECARSIRL